MEGVVSLQSWNMTTANEFEVGVSLAHQLIDRVLKREKPEELQIVSSRQQSGNQALYASCWSGRLDWCISTSLQYCHRIWLGLYLVEYVVQSIGNTFILPQTQCWQ